MSDNNLQIVVIGSGGSAMAAALRQHWLCALQNHDPGGPHRSFAPQKSI